jgi:hypothetical protein
VLQLVGYLLALLVPMLLIFQKDSFHIPANYFIMFTMFFAFMLFIIPNNPLAKSMAFEQKDFASEQTRHDMEQAEAAAAATDSIAQAAPAAAEGHEHVEGETH